MSFAVRVLKDVGLRPTAPLRAALPLSTMRPPSIARWTTSSRKTWEPRVCASFTDSARRSPSSDQASRSDGARRQTDVTTNAEDQRLGEETTMSKWIGMTIAPAVTGRSLVESPSTQVRSLEGRPLGMSSSLMLPESSRLSGRAVCDKASSTHGIGGLGVLVTRPAWHQAIVDIDGESLKGR